MVSANLALLLAKTGKKVCLIDLDLGGADSHILFGLLNPKKTLTAFLTRKTNTIDDIVHTFYSYNGLKLIPGTGETLQTANMTYQEKQRLLRGVSQLEADILIIDTGAGTSYHGLDFFMYSDIQICITQPDPTSILDMYTFLRLATIRKVLSTFLSQSEIGVALKRHNFNTLTEVFQLAEKTERGAKKKVQLALKYFHPLLIINRDSENNKVNKIKLKKMVAKYLTIDIPELGEIPVDNHVNQALKAFMPVCELYPSSPASLALVTIAEKTAQIIELFTNPRPTDHT